MALYYLHGRSINLIAHETKLTMAQVQRMINTFVKDVDKGHWTLEEQENLKNGIKSVMKINDISNLRRDLPWAKIAEFVPTRDGRQCRRHWLTKLCFDPNNNHIRERFRTVHKLKLIYLLYHSGKDNEREIHWDNLETYFHNGQGLKSCLFSIASFEELKEKWSRLRNLVPDYLNKDFADIIGHLYGTYYEEHMKKMNWTEDMMKEFIRKSCKSTCDKTPLLDGALKSSASSHSKNIRFTQVGLEEQEICETSNTSNLPSTSQEQNQVKQTQVSQTMNRKTLAKVIAPSQIIGHLEISSDDEEFTSHEEDDNESDASNNSVILCIPKDTSKIPQPTPTTSDSLNYSRSEKFASNKCLKTPKIPSKATGSTLMPKTNKNQTANPSLSARNACNLKSMSSTASQTASTSQKPSSEGVRKFKNMPSKKVVEVLDSSSDDDIPTSSMLPKGSCSSEKYSRSYTMSSESDSDDSIIDLIKGPTLGDRNISIDDEMFSSDLSSSEDETNTGSVLTSKTINSVQQRAKDLINAKNTKEQNASISSSDDDDSENESLFIDLTKETKGSEAPNPSNHNPKNSIWHENLSVKNKNDKNKSRKKSLTNTLNVAENPSLKRQLCNSTSQEESSYESSASIEEIPAQRKSDLKSKLGSRKNRDLKRLKGKLEDLQQLEEEKATCLEKTQRKLAEAESRLMRDVDTYRHLVADAQKHCLTLQEKYSKTKNLLQKFKPSSHSTQKTPRKSNPKKSHVADYFPQDLSSSDEDCFAV